MTKFELTQRYENFRTDWWENVRTDNMTFDEMGTSWDRYCEDLSYVYDKELDEYFFVDEERVVA